MQADEAYAHGVVSRVVPADELDATAREMAEKIAASPAVTIKMARRVLRHLSEAEVVERLRAYASAGATDLCATALGLDDDRDASQRRTIELLASLAPEL
jgi:enoyl-CoA hydratase/carnithine racemase